MNGFVRNLVWFSFQSNLVWLSVSLISWSFWTFDFLNFFFDVCRFDPSSGFQRNNRFWKICIKAWDIDQTVAKSEGSVWQAKIYHILTDYLGFGANFSKPIFAMKGFEYNEAYEQNEIFLTYNGPSLFLLKELIINRYSNNKGY